MPWGLRRIKARGAILGTSGPETAPKGGCEASEERWGVGSSFISPVPEGAEGSGAGQAGPREEGRLGRLLRPEAQPSAFTQPWVRGVRVSVGVSRASKLLG